jgi:MFS family permease
VGARGERGAAARPAGAPGPLAPLRHRQFLLVWLGAFVSNVGTWMETIAVGVLVTDVTGRSGWTGIVAAAAFLPMGVLSPLGGALADRVDRRRLFLLTTLAQAALATILTVLAAQGTPSPGVVTLIVFMAGCVGALGFPAYQAALPDLVPPEDLLGAVALGQAQYNLGRVIGPALAGVVIALGGYAWAFGVNAVSFGAMVAALTILRLPPTVPSTEPVARAVREGWTFAWSEPGIRLSLVTLAVVGLLASPFIGLVPAMAELVFDEPGSGAAVLVTAQGIGAVAAGLVLGTLAARIGRRRVLVGAVALLPVALLAYSAAPGLWPGAVAILFVGGLYLAQFSSLGAVMQLRSPRAMRGRASSLFMVVLGVTYPIGLALQGWLGDHLGLARTTGGAAVLLGVIVLGTAVLRPGITRHWDDLPEDGSGAGADDGGADDAAAAPGGDAAADHVVGSPGGTP